MIPLKTTLMINAASSAGTGTGLILFATPTAELFGISQTLSFIGVGTFLVLFAAYVFMTGIKKPLDQKAVRLIITLDTVWVIASVVLITLAYSAFSSIGIFVIIAVAGWVAAMAILQHKGLKMLPSKSVNIIILAICSLLYMNHEAFAQSVSPGPVTGFVSTARLNRPLTKSDEALAVTTAFLEAIQEKSHAKAALVIDSLIQWHQPGNNRFTGVKKDAKEVFAMFKGFMEMSASTLKLTNVKVLAVNGNSVACHLHWNAVQPQGGILDVDNIDVYTVEHGKIVRAVVYTADAEQEDKFWLK